VKLEKGRRYTVEVAPDDPSLGPSSAPVTLVVFSDYQCPFCARLEPVLTALRERFPEHLRIVWKDLPLVFHEYALPAAILGREAFTKYGNDGFWRVHAELFIHQRSFSDEWFSDFARAEKLTWPPDASYQSRIGASLEQADSLGVAATPTAFVNGRPVEGAQHVSVYADLINEELGQ
jgi:protein-disulfide isomerase